MSDTQLPDLMPHPKTPFPSAGSSKYRYRKSLINKKYDWVNQSWLDPQGSAIHQYLKINLTNKVAVFRQRQLTENSVTLNECPQFCKQNKKVLILNHSKPVERPQEDLRTCKSLLNTKLTREVKRTCHLELPRRERRHQEHRSLCDLEDRQRSENVSKCKREEFELRPWKYEEAHDKENIDFY